MSIIRIIVGGRFGLRAVKYLLKQDKAFQVVLVDRDQKKLDQASELDCMTELADGISYLNTQLKSGNLPAWIVL